MAYDLNEQAGEEQDVSKINAAGLINLRVQSAWDSCRRFYNNGNYDGLRDELASLWPEFFSDSTAEQKKKLVGIEKEILEAFKKKATRNKKIHLKFNSQYKRAVYKKWLFLKTLEKSQGVGKAYRDEGADEWE